MRDARMTTVALPPALALEQVPAGLEEEWRALDRIGSHSFFLSWTWIGTWLRFCPGRTSLLRATREGETVGLALVSFRKGMIRGLLPVSQAWLNAAGDPEFDTITIEHNGFATARDDLLPSLVSWFEASDVDELVLPGIAAGLEPPAGKLIRLHRSNKGYRAPLDAVAGSGVDVLLSRNARQQLRRSMRDYEAMGPLALDAAADVDTALAYFSGLKEMHIRSWNRRGRRHAFVAPFFETFHRSLIADGIADGTVDLLRVTCGGRPIGYLYNFRRNGIVSSYQSGFDDEEPGQRPGYVCHALAINHYAAAGMSYYDFLAGTNRLKESFGTEQYELSWRHYRKPKAGFRAEALARSAVAYLKRIHARE